MRLHLLLLSTALWGLSRDAWAGADTSAEALVVGFGIGGLFGLAGLILGLGLANRRRAVEPEALIAAGPVISVTKGLPVLAGRQLWRVPDAAARSRCAVALARRLSSAGPVLLLPDPTQRATALREVRTAPGVRWLEPERPDPGAVHAGLNTLGQQGTSVLVVDGPNAVEDIEALQVLFRDLDVPTVVLIDPSFSPPKGWTIVDVDPTAMSLPIV